jgi:hypothetical protein
MIYEIDCKKKKKKSIAIAYIGVNITGVDAAPFKGTFMYIFIYKLRYFSNN